MRRGAIRVGLLFGHEIDFRILPVSSDLFPAAMVANQFFHLRVGISHGRDSVGNLSLETKALEIAKPRCPQFRQGVR